MRKKKAAKHTKTDSTAQDKHGPLYQKNVRYHSKDGTTCLVTYSQCKDRPIDIKTYSGESKYASTPQT